MAEGGSETLQNNLCQNQEKKVPEGKKFEQKSGFPEVPMSESYSSTPHALMPNGFVPPTLDAKHRHSNQSETGLKDILEKAPSLSRSTPNSDVDKITDPLSRSDSAGKISNVDPVPMRHQCEAKDQPPDAEAGKLEAAEQPGSRSQEEEEEEEEGSSILSSYLRAGVASMDPVSPSPPPSTPAPSQGEQKGPTNDLSASHTGGPPPAAPPFLYPQMMGAGINSMMGGMMPVFYYPFPVSYSPTGHPPMMSPMFASQPYYPMTHSTGQYPQPHMMHNISCGHLGMNGAAGMMGVNGAMGGNGVAGGNGATGKNGVTGGSPPMTMFGGYSSQGSLDSRNIPVNNTGSSAPSSEENNCDGSRSYSINPGRSTQLTRLRGPVLQWIRKNLDRGCSKNWEALADARGWNYQEIRDHYDDCKHSRESPFLKLLETETFFTYTVHDFLYDMERIGRRDIRRDFDEVLQKNARKLNVSE